MTDSGAIAGHAVRTASWRISRERLIPLDRPRFMAILNITPDSFYDGGVLTDAGAAAAAATRAVAEGAEILDIGGESTRPGAASVPEVEQIARVVPVIHSIRTAGVRTPISVDTTSAAVARAALGAGANAINDTSAGLDDGAMLPLAAERGAGLILMHRLRRPHADSYSDRYMDKPRYTDVVTDVCGFLAGRAAAAAEAGIEHDAIVLDPGLGFGKTVEQNLELIRRTPELAALGHPVLSGLSRKSFTGVAAGLSASAPGDRLPGTIALSIAHMRSGASIFRVHDVAAHVQAFAAARSAEAAP